jgi:hypothetical protein
MNDLNELKNYHQKSMIFLYPLLNLPANIKPDWTYMYVDNLKFNNDCNLICVFDASTDTKKEVHDKLRYNKYFDLHIKEDESNIYIFDLTAFFKDYKLIEQGLYSKVHDFTKTYLAARQIHFLGLNALFPMHSYKKYSEHFNYPMEELYGNELLDSPDKDCETLYSESIVNIIKDEYAICSMH